MKKGNFLSKEMQFITEIQTGVIIRSVIENNGKGYDGMWSAMIHMDDAFNSAVNIPEDKTAHEAACEFLEFIFKDNEESPGIPSWVIRI